MITNLEYEVGKLIALVKKKNLSKCCGRARLQKAFNRVTKALEIEQNKENSAYPAEELSRLEAVVQELAKEVGLQ